MQAKWLAVRRQNPALSELGERNTQRAKHAKPEQIELDEPSLGAVVLVPLEDSAPLHASPAHRAHINDGPIADHHPARVNAQMPR